MDARCQWKEYCEGYDSYKCGKSIHDNPYRPFTNEEYSWAYGWNAARQNA